MEHLQDNVIKIFQISNTSSLIPPNNLYPIIRVFNENKYIISNEIITSTDDVKSVIDKL